MYKEVNSFEDWTEPKDPEYLELKKRFKNEFPEEYKERFGEDES